MDLLDLPAHWTATDPDCISARKKYAERKLWDCIDRLEALVVRRLFELQKCHIASTSKTLSQYISITDVLQTTK